jgi:hypothetical protein
LTARGALPVSDLLQVREFSRDSLKTTQRK